MNSTTIPQTLPLSRLWLRLLAAIVIGYAWHLAFDARADHAPRAVLPNAVVDLRTVDGARRVQAQWRYSDTHIHEIDHRSVGPDLKGMIDTCSQYVQKQQYRLDDLPGRGGSLRVLAGHLQHQRSQA